MDTKFKDSNGRIIKTTDTIRFTDETGSIIESGIYATWIGLSVRLDTGTYSQLQTIVNIFETEII